MVGSSISMVVLPVLVYDLTGSAGLTGLLAATRLIPYLVLGLIAGPIADRSSRRRLIIGGNVAEGVLAATIPIAAMADALTAAHVFVVALLSATAYVFSDAAVFGAVPALVRPERLADANGVLSVFGSSADIAGPVLAGVLITTIGATHGLTINAISFLAAAAVQLTIHSDFRRPINAASPARRPTIRQQLGAAFTFIRRQTTVLTLIAVGFGNSLAIGIVLGLLVPWSVEVLGYASDDPRLGVLYAAVGVGSLAAGLVFARLFSAARVRVLTPAAVAWSALCSIGLAAGVGWLATPAMAAFSFGIMVTITTGITYRQLATPDQLVSTVNTIGRMIAAGGQPVGAALGALIATVLTVTAAYTTAAGLMATTALAAHLALRRRDTSLPEHLRPSHEGDPAGEPV